MDDKIKAIDERLRKIKNIVHKMKLDGYKPHNYIGEHTLSLKFDDVLFMEKELEALPVLATSLAIKNEKVKELEKKLKENEQPEYEQIISMIKNTSKTYLPAIIAETIKTAIENKVFIEGKAHIFVKKVEEAQYPHTPNNINETEYYDPTFIPRELKEITQDEINTVINVINKITRLFK